MNKTYIVTAGHVDHGKSTVIGRLLAESKSLPRGKLAQVKKMCEKNAKTFEYAYLIDALKDEQSQGITIDTARVFFRYNNRDYVIMDAPGHIEFLKNMVTGASRADGALLVIDASSGIQENSKRHAHILSLLGIKQILIVINKMDLISYSREMYEKIVGEYGMFLSKIAIKPISFIPVSGISGENITKPGTHMNWFRDNTLIQSLENFENTKPLIDKPFRMPVQDVYRFSSGGDYRRIIVGTIESGSISTGDEIIFYPSGKKSTVKSIESFNTSPLMNASAGQATGITLQEEIYVQRGEIATKKNEQKPEITTEIRASVLWLGKEPLVKNKEYLFKLATAKVPVKVEKILNIIDSSTLNSIDIRERIERHYMAECVLKLHKAIAFDTIDFLPATGRFVIIDNYDIKGGGIIKESIPDRETWLRNKVQLRNYKWTSSAINMESRAEKYNQRPTLIIITGKKDMGKKPIARKLEEKLFADGRFVYFLGIGNILYGVDADIKGKQNDRKEHLRRLAEVANILLDAGILLIVTAIELTQEDLEIIKTVVSPDRIEIIWTGEEVTTDITYDLKISETGYPERASNMIKSMLQEKGIIYRPW